MSQLSKTKQDKREMRNKYFDLLALSEMQYHDS